MDLKTRLLKHNWIDDLLQSKVKKALEKENVVILKETESNDKVPVIIFFDVVTVDFFDCLKKECSDTQTCVLVVTKSPNQLSNGVNWKILKYGVDDILICNSPPESVAAQLSARIKRWYELQEMR